jgi:hypothetical protein
MQITLHAANTQKTTTETPITEKILKSGMYWLFIKWKKLTELTVLVAAVTIQE